MKKQSLNSLAIAIFLSANSLAWVISFIPRAIVFIVLFSWIILILNKQIPKIIRSPLYLHFSVMMLVLFFLFSINKNHTNAVYEYFTFFLVSGISGIYFSQINFSIKKVFKYLALIAIPMSVFIFKQDIGSFEEGTIDYGQLMGISYGILRYIIAVLVILFLYRKDYSVLTIIILVIALILFITFYFKFATRGAMLAVFLFLFIYYIIKEQQSKKMFFRLAFFSVIAISGIVFFSEIISFSNKQLNSIGIEVKALKKTEIFLLTDKAIDNGRIDIAQRALKDVYKSIFFGHGVAGYERKNNDNYVHNVFLQTIYEGGILLFLPIFIIVMIGTFILFKKQFHIETRVFILFLFTAGIVELLFSNVFWKSQFFWFYIFFILTTISAKKPIVV